MNKEKVKKYGKIALNVLLYLFLAICVVTVFITLISAKEPDGARNVFGYQMRLVTTGSMEKSESTDVSGFKIGSIPKNSMIFIDLVPEDSEEAKTWYDDLEVGDVLTVKYVYTSQIVITHRIISKEPVKKNGEIVPGGYIITIEGDNKNDTETQMTQVINTTLTESPNYVIGKVTGTAVLLGGFLSLIKTTVGTVFIIIIPCAIIAILEAIRIYNAVTQEKKLKEKKEKEAAEEELRKLKEKLRALEEEKKNEKKTDSAESETPTASVENEKETAPAQSEAVTTPAENETASEKKDN